MTIRAEFYMVCDGPECFFYLGERESEGGEDIICSDAGELAEIARGYGWHTNDLDGANLCPECWRTVPLADVHAEDQAVPARRSCGCRAFEHNCGNRDAPTDLCEPHGIARPDADLLDEIDRAEAAGHYSHAAKLIERIDP